MQFVIYLTFKGNCEEAMNFYANAFNTQIASMQRFGDMPADEAYPVAEEEKNLVMHSSIVMGGQTLMASDAGKNHPFVLGNNISISIDCRSMDEIRRLYAGLSEGGQQTMPLSDTFWGAHFGMCTDKFGVNWMFNLDKA
jgi:PhnB protein